MAASVAVACARARSRLSITGSSSLSQGLAPPSPLGLGHLLAVALLEVVEAAATRSMRSRSSSSSPLERLGAGYGLGERGSGAAGSAGAPPSPGAASAAGSATGGSGTWSFAARGPLPRPGFLFVIPIAAHWSVLPSPGRATALHLGPSLERVGDNLRREVDERDRLGVVHAGGPITPSVPSGVAPTVGAGHHGQAANLLLPVSAPMKTCTPPRGGLVEQPQDELLLVDGAQQRLTCSGSPPTAIEQWD